MAFYLTVNRGADEGRSFRIEPGEYLIGRSPSALIQLKDDSVAWEHAKVREQNGKLYIQNLSAAGVRVKGTRITDEVRVGPNTEIQLTEQCRMLVEERLAGGGTASGTQTVMLMILLLMIVVGGVGMLLSHREPKPRPMLERHWRQAYTLLDSRMTKWIDEESFPPQAAELFREAWRMDQTGSYGPAAQKWAQLRALLLVLPMKFPSDYAHATWAEVAGPTPKALGIIMGWDREAASTDFAANTDTSYADALVWFVRKRADIMKARAAE